MDNFDKFYNKALNFLSFRPRSEKELRDYLRKKLSKAKSASVGVDDLTVNKIIQKLKEYKFLNDEEFAKWWVEQRTLIKPKATRVIKFELIQKGIDKELIEKIFLSAEVSDLEKATSLAQKRLKRYSEISDRKKIYEKLGRFLISKGFNYDTIKEVIDQLLPKGYNN